MVGGTPRRRIRSNVRRSATGSSSRLNFLAPTSILDLTGLSSAVHSPRKEFVGSMANLVLPSDMKSKSHFDAPARHPGRRTSASVL